MRFFLAPLLLSSTVLASLSPSKILSSRQAVVKRDLIDVCAYLDLDLQIDDPLNGKPLVLGKLDLCLCVSVLPIFIKTNVIAALAVDLIGETKLLAQLEALIEGESNKKQCKYPTHATPACLPDNLCTFNCTSGYSPYPASAPTTCTCPPPLKECNGQCGEFPHGCGSQAATPPNKMKRADRCGADEQVCGTGSKNGWECVKTASDLFSCGGCSIASPFASSVAPSGVDCSSIPNVEDVACVRSQCAVTSCKSGFAVSSAGDSCVPTSTSSSNVLVKQTSQSKRHGSAPLVGAIVGEAAGVITPVVGAAEAAGAAVKIGRNAPGPAIVEGVVGEAAGAVIPEVLGAAEAAGAAVKIGRDLPIVGAVVGEAAGAFTPVIGVVEDAGAAIKIGRDLPNGPAIVEGVVGEAAGAVVPGVLGAVEAAGAAVKVGRDLGVPPIVEAVVGEAAGVVTPVVGVVEAGGAAIKVGRDSVL